MNKNEKEKCLILPSNYFYPYPNFLINKFNDKYKLISHEPVGLHHWEMSWIKGNIFKRIYNKLISYLKRLVKIFIFPFNYKLK